MPAPIPLVRPGDLISAAKFNEVIEELNALAQISGAYPIEVHHDAAGVRIGLARQFQAWLFRIQTVPSVLPLTADNVPYYSATRLRLNSTDSYTPQSPSDVQLYDPLAKDVSAKRLMEGDWVLATFDADTGRWQIVRDPFRSVQVVRFKLTTTLTLGGSATAIIRQYDASVPGYVDGDTITVKDYFGAIGDPGEWQGYEGHYGFAVKLPDLDEWQILYLEHVARFIAFTTTSIFSTQQAAASLSVIGLTRSYWGGKNTSGFVNVWDSQNLYAAMPEGSPGIAVWDEFQEEYRVIDMGGGGDSLLLFYLNAPLTKGGSADASLLTWNAGTSTWDVGMTSVTVFDSAQLGPALMGDRGVCFLSQTSGRYEVVSLPGTGGVKIIRFKTTDPLALGGTAGAVKQNWNAGTSTYDDGDAITVVDFYGSLGRRGKFQGPSGLYGFAVNLGDKDEWQIIDMERIALFAVVQLTEDMGATTPHVASCTFPQFWEGQTTAGATAVLDTVGIYGSLIDTEYALAVWDDNSVAYRLIDGQQGGSSIKYARAYADHTLAGTSKSNSHYVECQPVDDITGAGYDSGSDHFNVLLPSPSAAQDPNVEAGVVIGYTTDDDGNHVCVTDYLDDCRKTIKIWGGTAASIPHGWHLCDGSNGTPDLRSKFVVGASPGDDSNFDGNENGTDVGDSGGQQKHKHDDHEPQPTSAVTLTATTEVVTSSAADFIGYPTNLDTSPNMTGFPVATGFTEGADLRIIGGAGDIGEDPTIDTSDTSLTATVDGGGTSQIRINTPGTSKGSTQVCVVGSGLPDEGEDGCPGYTLDSTISISPNGHHHTVDVGQIIDAMVFDFIIQPNPHNHFAQLPVEGITFSPSSTEYTPEGRVTLDIGAEAETIIVPGTHFHYTPTLEHSQAYHIPPYFALCYIMRTS